MPPISPTQLNKIDDKLQTWAQSLIEAQLFTEENAYALINARKAEFLELMNKKAPAEQGLFSNAHVKNWHLGVFEEYEDVLIAQIKLAQGLVELGGALYYERPEKKFMHQPEKGPQAMQQLKDSAFEMYDAMRNLSAGLVNTPVELKMLNKNGSHVRDLEVAANAATTMAIAYKDPDDGVAVANVLKASNAIYNQTGSYWNKVKSATMVFAAAVCVVAAVVGAAFTGGASLAILGAAGLIMLNSQHPDNKISATQVTADKISTQMHAFVKEAKTIVDADLKQQKLQPEQQQYRPPVPPRPQR